MGRQLSQLPPPDPPLDPAPCQPPRSPPSGCEKQPMERKMIDDFEQQRVKLSTGVELDVVDIGPRDAPALIFLHGFPESHRTWRHQLPHFANRFRCIAPDQRGYCGSSKPQDVADYTPD